MFILDPDFCPSRIPGLKTTTKERGEKKLIVLPFLDATKITNLKNIFTKNCKTFYPKNCFKLSKIWGWARELGKTYPESKGQNGTLTNIAEQAVCSCGFRLVQYSRLLLLVYQ
jgi:hypothetical protein